MIHGPDTLTDVELVAVLLSARQASASAFTVATRLLRTVGGVPGLSRHHPDALRRLVGESLAARLVAALALPLRRDLGDVVTVAETADLVPVFRPMLHGRRRECLAVAVCDRRNRVTAVRAVTDGDSAGAPFPVRDIVATVLRHDGHAFAIAHNHPSGDPTPSAQDRGSTKRCWGAAELAGLNFLGHVVLGEHDTWASA